VPNKKYNKLDKAIYSKNNAKVMVMSRKVLLITSIFPPQSGGPAIFTQRFGKWLKSKNYELFTISYLNGMKSPSKDLELIELGSNRLFSFIKFILAIKRNSDKETIILANGAFVETYLACLFTKRKYVAKIPGDQVWEIAKNKSLTTCGIEEFQNQKMRPKTYLLRRLFSVAYKNSKFVITPSNQLKEFATKWGVSEDKIKLIFNCVDPLEFTTNNNSIKKYDVVTVCRLVPWKGLEELITCAKLNHFSLAIVGDGPLRTSLEKLANSDKAAIHFMGNLENYKVSQILSQSKIFVLNSEYEATSYALIEAKMCGLPIIAKETSGSTIVVQNKIDGLIINKNNSDQLGQIINNLLQDPVRIDKFGSEARIDALTRFNQEINFLQLLAVLES